MAETVGIRLLEKLFPGIGAGPLYYISTHGEYDMQLYDDIETPTKGEIPGIDSFKVVVPDKTIVIEFAKPGDVCYFSEIKRVLEPLLGDRQRLLSYLSGIPPASDSPELQAAIKGVLAVCYIYKPGDIICNRILTMGAGMTKMASGVMSSERTSEYSKMGFLEFEPPNPEPKPVLSDLRTVLIKGSYGRLNERGRSKNYSPSYTTYQKLLHYYLKPIEVFKIVIFPVCATVDPSDTISMEDATRVISEIQMAAKRSWIDLISGRRFNMGPVLTANKYVLSSQNHAARTAGYQRAQEDYKAKLAEYRAILAEQQAILGAGGGGGGGGGGPVYGSGGGGPVYGSGGGGGGGGGGGSGDMEGGGKRKYRSMRNPRKTKKKRKPSKHTRRH